MWKPAPEPLRLDPRSRTHHRQYSAPDLIPERTYLLPFLAHAAAAKMSTQHHAMISETLLALNRALKRRDYGQQLTRRLRPRPPYCYACVLTAVATACRFRFRLLNRPLHEPRQQAEETSEVRPPRSIDVVHGPSSVQGGVCRAWRGALSRWFRHRTDEPQVADHSGYQRVIIHRNPPLIDEDGYDIDSDDDEEQVQEAIASAMEENPYSSIRLERAFTRPCCASKLSSEPSADLQ